MKDRYFIRVVRFWMGGANYDTMPKEHYSEIDGDYYRWIKGHPKRTIELIKLTDTKDIVIKQHKPYHLSHD